MNPTAVTKRIGHTTYIKLGSLLGEVKGPYRPGNIWKAEIYQTKPEFEAAWIQNKVTAVQLGKVSAMEDRIFAALSFGQTNAIDHSFFTKNKCLGYRYKSKALAVEAINQYFERT